MDEAIGGNNFVMHKNAMLIDRHVRFAFNAFDSYFVSEVRFLI